MAARRWEACKYRVALVYAVYGGLQMECFDLNGTTSPSAWLRFVSISLSPAFMDCDDFFVFFTLVRMETKVLHSYEIFT